jgi:hypothetical protein
MALDEGRKEEIELSYSWRVVRKDSSPRDSETTALFLLALVTLTP